MNHDHEEERKALQRMIIILFREAKAGDREALLLLEEALPITCDLLGMRPSCVQDLIALLESGKEEQQLSFFDLL